MEFKAYHKIKQFKDVVRDIRFKANYKGLGSDGSPIYEESEKPTIRFTGTVKLHGTNAGICYHPNEGIVAQKRSSLIGINALDAHFEFNRWVQVTEKEALKTLMNSIWKWNCSDDEQITLYGEWAGSNIQQGVGISALPKAFYTFDCKAYNIVTKESRWIDISGYEYSIENMYNIHQFDTYSLDIDFNKPELYQNTLVGITEAVEHQCPVAGSGIGEGVVWTGFWNGDKYIFKVKGEKHSTTKVKKLASTNPETIRSIYEFVDFAVTENRVDQGILETNASEKRDMPELLRWVANDIMTEDNDALVSNNLEWRQVAREVNNRVRQYFFSKIESIDA